MKGIHFFVREYKGHPPTRLNSAEHKLFNSIFFPTAPYIYDWANNFAFRANFSTPAIHRKFPDLRTLSLATETYDGGI